MPQDDPVGPLEIARENAEYFADSLLQQHMLRSVVDVYKNSLAIISLSADDETKEQIELLWTAIADEWSARGISA